MSAAVCVTSLGPSLTAVYDMRDDKVPVSPPEGGSSNAQHTGKQTKKTSHLHHGPPIQLSACRSSFEIRSRCSQRTYFPIFGHGHFMHAVKAF